eukprot:257897_1
MAECIGYLGYEDETGCGVYTCAGTGDTISWDWTCDGEVDCLHGDDEFCDLGPFCPGYQCDDQGTSLKTCIPNDWRCDGETDCLYGDDEDGCPTRSPTDVPTRYPTKHPSDSPTKYPTMPSINPTQPTAVPSRMPSKTPSYTPTSDPSQTPTDIPTRITYNPSTSPTVNPSTPSPISPFPFVPILGDIECGDTVTGTTTSTYNAHFFRVNLTLYQVSLMFDNCDDSYEAMDSRLTLYSWNTNNNQWGVLNTCDDDCGDCSPQEQLLTYNVQQGLYYFGVAGWDEGETGYYSAHMICSNTMQPTVYPTYHPTNPTSIPTVQPTNQTSIPTRFTSQPTVRVTESTAFYSTSNPTTAVTANPTVSNTVQLMSTMSEETELTDPNDIKSEDERIQVRFTAEGGLYYLVIIGAILAGVIAIICVWYLAMSKLTSRTLEIGTASFKQTFHQLGLTEKFSLVIEVFDVVTDYLFAVDLITNNNASNDVILLGWISLFAAIIGCLFFYVKLLLTKKLIGFQVPLLKQQLKRRLSVAQDTIDNIQQNELMMAMRQRRIDIYVITLLIACFEDCPQAIIVVIIVSSNIGWTSFSVLNIAMSVLGFCVKCLQIVMAKYGCQDPDDVHETDFVARMRTTSGVTDSPRVDGNNPVSATELEMPQSTDEKVLIDTEDVNIA